MDLEDVVQQHHLPLSVDFLTASEAEALDPDCICDMSEHVYD